MVCLTEGITPQNLARVYSDPLIQRTGDDRQAVYPVFHPLATYLSAWIGDLFVGAYLVIVHTDTEYELHTLLLKQATKQSRRLCHLLLDWVFSHPDVLRATGPVREGLESTRNHCLKMGFKLEGFRRDAVTVKGEPKGFYIMGITRKEWAQL